MNGEVRIQDGEKHIFLQCSNCDAYIVDLFVTTPDAPVSAEYSAQCPWCQDCAFPVLIEGLVSRAGVGYPKEDDPEDWLMSTVVLDDRETDNGYHFICGKDGPDARPCFNPG